MQPLGKGVHSVDSPWRGVTGGLNRIDTYGGALLFLGSTALTMPLTLASSMPGMRGMVTSPFFCGLHRQPDRQHPAGGVNRIHPVNSVNQTVNIPPGVGIGFRPALFLWLTPLTKALTFPLPGMVAGGSHPLWPPCVFLWGLHPATCLQPAKSHFLFFASHPATCLRLWPPPAATSPPHQCRQNDPQ